MSTAFQVVYQKRERFRIRLYKLTSSNDKINFFNQFQERNVPFLIYLMRPYLDKTHSYTQIEFLFMIYTIYNICMYNIYDI